MATFGLWYFRWNGEENVSTLGSAENEFERFFDYAVALPARERIGSGVKELAVYTGNGFNDGRKFASDVFSTITSVPVYLAIPYWKSNIPKPRENPRGGNKYWLDWLDGVLSVESSNLRGLYWSLESVWMFVNYYKDVLCGNGQMPYVNPQTIDILSEEISSRGLKFIWIPYAKTYALQYTDIWSREHMVCGKRCPIPGGSEFFDIIFVQPNYYQCGDWYKNVKWTDRDGKLKIGLSLEEWVSLLSNITRFKNVHNVFIEFECDGRILTGGKDSCSGIWHSSVEFRDRACKYVEYGRQFANKAYYFDTNLDNLSIMNSYCRKNLGERYV